MSTDSEMLKERQKLRYQVLKVMFDATVGKGESTKLVRFSADELIEYFVKHSDFSDDEVRSALSYLENEGLLVNPYDQPIFKITHKGVVEIERSIKFPEQRTQHFMLSVVQHFHGSVSSVQNAPNSTANVNQKEDY